MRERILAVVDELKRRKADGESEIVVSPASVAALRVAASARAGRKSDERPAAAPPVVTAREERPAAPPPIIPAREERPAASRPPPAYAPPPVVTARDEQPQPSYAARVTRPVERAAPPADAKLPPPPIFSLPEGDKLARWEWLRERVVNCPVCNANLNPGKQVVFGHGNIDSPIFFCGEAPGADEEKQGIPFVGKAGQLLVKIISAMGLTREDVYIGNIMNWRPQTGQATGNRPPSEEEMAFCLPYLRAQVDVVRPKVLVALGNTAVTGLLGPDPRRRLGAIRGKWFDFKGTPLMPTYHPSYVLQYGNNTTKRQIWEDMLAVMEKVGMEISDKQRGYFKV
ncbi:MAG: uracil-DNA glycosylase [Opitutales bacterium]|jgi:DNA polymerase